ncbi:serine hydrolase [Parasphingopyxis algicola]|uniref:serine hydrolase domain-containing protein n=1 Tax=Parasphingopyxis algicola TaxID=2026624 RepID=UPI0015A3574A|nr:serine hydrolase [Parasphingopyxis algicola]QLC24037.1 serine hydrolase [Parasphingopyxis algicola]
MKKLILATAATFGLALASPANAQDTAEAESHVPTDLNILMWTQPQRDFAFPRMEELAPVRTIPNADTFRELPRGPGLDLAIAIDGESWTLDRYFADQRAAGVIVIHNGEVRLERYRMGADVDTRWTSFSVAKSLTSTLVGAAIADGHIASLDAPVTDYIPELRGSGYDGVTVRQLLTMTSGVRWNEDYTDPNSDVSLFNQVTPEPGVDPVVTYMRTLESEVEPGTRWQYNTGETNLIGVVVANAVGMPLADYLSQKIWSRIGMAQDGEWIVNAGGNEIAGCCISATVRDYARFGLFVLGGGTIGDERVVPEGWFAAAGTRQADIGAPGRGYGYQWWTFDDSSFAAQGIFGQGIFIDPARNLVIASNGNWPVASEAGYRERRNAFYRAVQMAVDAEGGGE